MNNWKNEEVTEKQLAYGDRLLSGLERSKSGREFLKQHAETIEKWENEEITRGEASLFINALKDYWEID